MVAGRGAAGWEERCDAGRAVMGISGAAAVGRRDWHTISVKANEVVLHVGGGEELGY